MTKLTYIQRFVITWRYGRHACGDTRIDAALRCLTDPIATLNPVYDNVAYVESMVRHTASAIWSERWLAASRRRVEG